MENATSTIQLTRVATATAQPQLCQVTMSDDGRWLFGGGYDGQVWQWDLLRVMSAPRESLAAPALSSALSSAKKSKAPPANDLQLPFKQFAGHNGWVGSLAMSDSLLATADSWGVVRLWEADDWLSPRWHVEAHDGWIRCAAFSNDGRWLATCGRDQTVQIREVETGRLTAQWRHEFDLTTIAFTNAPSPTWHVGDARGKVHRWQWQEESAPSDGYDAGELYKYDRIQDVGGVKALAVHPDGGTLAVAGCVPTRGATVQGVSTLMLFDMETGERRSVHEVGAVKDGYVHQVQWHPGGFWMLITCGTPGTGQLVFQRPNEEKPFFVHSKVMNPHSFCYCAQTQMLAVADTNRGSNGNGRRLTKDGEYACNTTPVELFDLMVHD